MIFMICILYSFILVGCAEEKNLADIRNSNQVYEDTIFALDTVISIKIYDHGSESLLEEIVSRIKEIENTMSATIETSEVEAINNSAGKQPVEVSEETFYVVQKAIQYSQLSGGKFDITMGPIVKLWGIGTENARLPEEEEILEKLQLVNYKKIQLDEKNSTVFLEDENMRIDLGGIAKGYVADEVAKILIEEGVKKALINLGGNVYAYGQKENGSPWKVGVQAPYEDRNDYFAVVKVSDQSIVTSGIYERYFAVEDKIYHHIFNSDTGYPVINDLASVTIVADQSIDADALSTTLFALGVKEGLALVETLEDIDCVYVTKDQEVYISSGIRETFTIIDHSFKLVN